jgi:hypothetical protein
MRNIFNDLQNKVTFTNLIDAFQIEKRILLVFVERQNSSKQWRASSQDDLVGLNLNIKKFILLELEKHFYVIGVTFCTIIIY